MNLYVHLASFILGIALLPSVSHASTTVAVRNQVDFDSLSARLISLLQSGESDILVTLEPGVYVAKESHLSLSGIKCPDTSLRFYSSGVVIVPEGKEYRNGDLYMGDFSINNSWMNGFEDVKTWTDIRYADGLVEVLDEESKKCRLKSRETVSQRIDCQYSYILIPHWYRSSVYKIDKYENGYVYFIADDLVKSSSGKYNINDDYNRERSGIRYKLSNVETGENYLRVVNGIVRLPKGVDSAREGVVNRVLVINNCLFKLLEISGFEFCGNSFSESKAYITVRNTKCETVLIHNCSFTGMRGSVISVVASSNVRVENNSFKDCYSSGIKSNNASQGTVIKNNRFESMGKWMNNTWSIFCQGEDYQVSGNTLIDFGYGGVGTGVWYKGTKNNPCSGVIERNDLCYSDDYLANIDNFATMDSGAIYVQTKNDNVVIKNNYIHGYSGISSNRGIFCDDGAYNVQVYGNVVLGIENSSSIESRRVASVEKSITPESGIERSNINVVIRDNVVDRRIRFVGNEKRDNGCVKGRNYYLVYPGKIRPLPIYQNFSEKQKDVYIDVNAVTTDGRIKVSSSSRHALSHSSAWPILRSILTP